MSTALNGPAAALGNNMRVGVESYFSLANQKGGIDGRLLELIVRDDGYEPERAAFNMRQLIDQDEVLAVIGNVGTPTAIVSVPIAEQKQTLLFGAFSGGGVLRKIPVSRYVINYRPSYAEETAEMVKGILHAGIEPQEIAFFTQRDGYGDAAYRGAVNALQKHGFLDTDKLIHGRYTRNTLNVEGAVAAMLDASITPKIIIMAGGYAPSAKFIELLRQDLSEIWFVNVSFVGSDALNSALSNDVKNVVVMQVVPGFSTELPIIDEYLEALHNYDSSLSPNDVSLEGFIVAKIFYMGLKGIEGDITKHKIIDGLETIRELDIGLGLPIYYDESDHQAIHTLWLTGIEGGKLNAFSWAQLIPTE
ncbi:MAG: ABC transporter substrate-binding protein [Piscirickettsiaceae bacterium]|nr:ABC transporter substrate-binding protein [Piscirickettsiaceae bacterium]